MKTLLKAYHDLVNSVIRNHYLLLAISALGITQLVFWSYASALPVSFIYFVDHVYLGGFYQVLIAKTIVAYASAHLVLLPFLLVGFLTPSNFFRYARVRRVFRLATRYQLQIRMSLFFISVMAVFLDGFILSIFLGFIGVIIGFVSAIVYRHFTFRSRLKRTFLVAIRRRPRTRANIRRTKQVLQGSRPTIRYDLRTLAIPTYIAVLCIFLGRLHAYHMLHIAEPIVLPNQEIHAVLLGQTKDYFMLYDREAAVVLAVSIEDSATVLLTEYPNED